MNVKILTAGECAVSVQMGDEINLEVNRLVRMLSHELEIHPIEGVTETVPTYASLMIHYRPEIILYARLREELSIRLKAVEALLEKTGMTLENTAGRKEIVKEIPVCYGGELGPDLEDCAAFEGVSVKELIRMHSSHDYYVYMLGFAPGHAYMARFEEPFHFKRRETPRVRIEARSIVAQENLSNLIPFEQPCGWNVIARTPLNICDYRRKDPFLVHPGEWVRYIPVNFDEYKKIEKADQKGAYVVKTYEKAVR